MEKIKHPSVNEIFGGEKFENRKKFIPEVGEQLKEETQIKIELEGQEINIDYREVSIREKENQNSDPVVLLSGFGSGWEGVSEMAFSLACEGRKVIMPSLPGYGNSDNPTKDYYENDNFDNEAEVIAKLLDKLELNNSKVHVIGHSMGSEIMASLAEKYPDKVSSLVLLNPAGIEEKENALALSSKFVLSGVHTEAEFSIRLAFSGEKDYEKELHNHIPEAKSPFSKDRIIQRLAEAKKISKGHLLEKIKNINIPVIYISGELDVVYPPGSGGENSSQIARVIENVKNKKNIETSVMKDLRHNTTFAPDEITAANIEHYLEKAEMKQFPTFEEMKSVFEQLANGNEYETSFEGKDEKGLYAWEIVIQKEDGGTIEYLYGRKGRHKDRKEEATAIEKAFFDENGFPEWGETVARYEKGKWRIIDDEDSILNSNKNEKMDPAEEFEKNLKSKREKVLEKAERVIVDKGLIWVNEESFIFSQKILEEFDDDAYHYISWHILGGSSPPKNNQENAYKLDFPGDFSVDSFYEELIKNLEEIDEFKHKKGVVIENKE